MDTFWTKVDKDGPLPQDRPDLGQCWIWTAGKLRGYGRFWIGGVKRYAHRVSYEHHVGPIPDGLEIDHLCRNPSCVRPAHLEAVTHRENNLRSHSLAAMRARQTHCKHGHQFTPENTYITKRGQRYCRACHNAAMRKRRAAESTTCQHNAPAGHRHA